MVYLNNDIPKAISFTERFGNQIDANLVFQPSASAFSFITKVEQGMEVSEWELKVQIQVNPNLINLEICNAQIFPNPIKGLKNISKAGIPNDLSKYIQFKIYYWELIGNEIKPILISNYLPSDESESDRQLRSNCSKISFVEVE